MRQGDYLKLKAREIVKKKRRLPKPLAPRSIRPLERQYYQAIRPFIETLYREINQRLISQLPSLVNQYQRNTNVKEDSAVDDVSRIFRTIEFAMEESWSPEQIKELARRQGLSVAEMTRRATERNFKKVLGIDLLVSDASLAEQLSLFTINNAQLIESIKTETLKKVETMTYVGMQNGTRVEQLAMDIEKLVNPNVGNVKARAMLIARDQTAKLSADINHSRQKELGFTKYTWRTVGDSRVRESHRENDGKVFSWDDPPPETGHPGEDYQCRCIAEPYFEELVSELDDDE